MENPKPNARNSPIRAAFNGAANGAAKLLIKVIPGVTADAVTYTGLTAVIAGSVVKILPRELISPETGSATSLGLMAFGVLCDALDGAVARNEIKPKDYNALNGALTDVIHNRFGETAMALSRIFAAGSRRDAPGVVAATISGLTAPLPSLLKAMVEKKGFFVPESGGNPLSFLGTRSTRAALTIPATSYPEMPIFGNNSQPILDILSALGNVAAVIERYFIYKKAVNNQLKINPDDEAKEFGRVKVERLGTFAMINTVALLAAGMIGLTAMNN
ncbi:CDP-alcohol phosphatidyltransferase family protein [Candidatus Roizmanbacteria bacterium]|nr:CDP-alcohol phosphatidyltransferase family protein [Candidatus Roizmanbacteria bacterium]